jgi:hypothetical protein
MDIGLKLGVDSLTLTKNPLLPIHFTHSKLIVHTYTKGNP